MIQSKNKLKFPNIKYQFQPYIEIDKKDGNDL